MHVCACSQEGKEIYYLNLASPGDESKAKFRFKSHHRGQEGFPGLTWLSAVCSRMGWQAGGSQQPVSGESFVVSRPLGPAVTAPGVGDPECSSDNHMPVPGAGGGGKEGAGHPTQASLCCRKAEGEEAGTMGQKEAQALLGLDGERGSRQEVTLAPGQTPPCQPLY